MSESIAFEDEEAFYDAALEKAHRYLEAERPDHAERELREALVRHPNSAELHGHLCWALEAQERSEEAMEAAQQAVALDPDEPTWHLSIGQLFMGKGTYSQAEPAILEALRLDANFAPAYGEYARLCCLSHQDPKALELVRIALRLDPDEARWHRLESVILTSMSREGAASAHRGLWLEPADEESHAALAASKLASGRPFAARKAWREAVRLDPSRSAFVEQLIIADRCCRFVFLPMYYFSLVIARLPGKHFFLWGCFIVAYYFLFPAFGVPAAAKVNFLLIYLAFCIYTWLALPLVKLWTKVRPLR